MIAVAFVRRSWGDASVVWSGAVLGLTDVDALTVSMARAATGDLPMEIAARGIATGLLANTSLKLAVALVLGEPRFRAVVGISLSGLAAVIAALLVFLR